MKHFLLGVSILVVLSSSVCAQSYRADDKGLPPTPGRTAPQQNYDTPTKDRTPYCTSDGVGVNGAICERGSYLNRPTDSTYRKPGEKWKACVYRCSNEWKSLDTCFGYCGE